MCGIVGFTGTQQAAPILLEGLKRLEYRGYDSAGIAVQDADRINTFKSSGLLENLFKLTDVGASVHGMCGIGHTRWATHGAPTTTNAHPHVSNDGHFAVVHNGIIENYAELREELRAKGFIFHSETDTEVIVNLLEMYYDGSLKRTVMKTVARLEGSYAIGVVCDECPGELVAVKNGCPLILGIGAGENFFASDVTAIIGHTRTVIYLEEGDFAHLTPETITVYDAAGREVHRDASRVLWNTEAAEKGGYEHFMFKEIMEQPEAVRKTISPRIKNKLIEFEELSLSDEYIASLSKIFIIACGSSYHVGMVGRYNLERLLRKPVEVMLASEFRYADPLVDEHTLVVVISQSGETLDSMAALREAKSLGARILSIVNVVGSSIARESDDVLYTWAGPEIAVATTKAYSTQLVLLDMFGVWLAKKTGSIKPSDYALIVEELLALPEKMESVLENIDEIKYLASRYFNHNSVFYIGRNLDYALGLEGSLKLKEISYIHSEAYAAGELKHGTISLIEEGTLVVALCTYAPLFDKAVSNIVEVQARGADVIALTTEGRRRQMGKTVENVLTVPDTHLILQPSLGVIPLQLFAYYVALQRGCDIDKPRNLAKSVTVE